jgi:hypothetical protein
MKEIYDFIKKMQEKYPCGKDQKICVCVEGDDIVVYQCSYIEWESDYWHELERIKIQA